MIQLHPTQSVTSAEFVRQFGRWQDRVATSPLVVTHHGRERLVALSVENYQALVGGAGAERGQGLTESDARLATLIERIGQGFLAIDEMLCVIEANPMACAHLGGQAAVPIGELLADACPDLAKSLLYSHIVRAARAGEAATFDAPSPGYPGHWLACQTFPYGRGAACLFTNVTDEMETRAQLRAKAALAAAMAAHGDVGHARLSPRATFCRIGPVLAGLAGFERDTLLGARLTDILPLNRRVEAADQVEAVLSGQGNRAFDSVLMVNNGGELPVRIALAELTGDHGSDGAIVLVTAG